MQMVGAVRFELFSALLGKQLETVKTLWNQNIKAFCHFYRKCSKMQQNQKKWIETKLLRLSLTRAGTFCSCSVGR